METTKIQIPYWKLEQLMSNPKSYYEVFYSCVDGERRSGRTTRLMNFYADMVLKGDRPKIIDHYTKDRQSSMKYDKELFDMVCNELVDRGYYRTTGYHLHEGNIGTCFIANHSSFKIWLVTNEDVVDCKERWERSIAHTTAFNRAFFGHD